MIGYLRGRIISRDDHVVIVLCGDVGYEIHVHQRTAIILKADADVSFFIHTHVREDDIALFGFLSLEEKRLFQTLISINGVGPKLALAIQSTFSPQDLFATIRTSDLARLRQVPGVGGKKAEKLFVELKSKFDLSAPGIESVVSGATFGQQSRGVLADLQTALQQLGYRSHEMAPLWSHLQARHAEKLETMALGDLIPQSLQFLSHIPARHGLESRS